MRHMKQFLGKHHQRPVVVFFFTCVIFLNITRPVTQAGPEGAQVINGDVSIQQNAYNTTITASDKAIINYSSFDIARPETVQFVQPSSSASVLNRILSASPTYIDGTLIGNGRVFFVNPAGIYIGAGARINVNQLVASGLNISNSDFINGRYHFAGGNGSVINNGDISAEEVYLIGQQVTNSGNISCPAGYVVMASGDRVFLGEPGSEIVLEIDESSLSESVDAAGSEASVLNEGTIEAAGGKIALAAAGDIYSQAISNVGSLSTSVETGDAGKVKLIAKEGTVLNSGTIDASGDEGGQVVMEGVRVGQFGTVHADGASGDGGRVDLKANEVVALSSNSLTTTNADIDGDGGDVIVFSLDTTLFRPGAKIQAKGGNVSGDGGFVEVSGQKHVEVYGTVDAGANNGLAGLLYIDPYNVEITDADASGSWDGGDPDTFTPTGTGSTILDTTLETHLGTQNVKISTVNGTGLEDGDITINAAIEYGGDNYLIFEADDDIIFGTTGAVTLTGGACDLTLIAGNTTTDGGILNNNDRTITMGTGALRMVADSGIGSSAHPILTANLTNVAATTQTGGIFINNSGSGNINVTAVSGTSGLTTTTSGNISVTNSAGNITLAQAITTTGDGTISLNAGTNAIDTDGQIVNAGAGSISFTSDMIDLGTTVGTIVTTDAVILQPATDTTAIGIGGATAAYQLDDEEIAAIADGASGITIGRSTGEHAVTIDAITFNDPVTIQTPSGGSIAVNGQIKGSGDSSITLDGPDATTTLSAGVVTSGQDITISDNVVIADNADVTLSTGAGAGNLSITGTINGTNAGGGDSGDESLLLNAGTGTVNLGDVFGAAGAADATGLTSLTIENSGAATFDKIGITGALTQTNAATGSTTFADTVALASATLRGSNFAINGSMNATGDVTINSTTDVTIGSALNANNISITAGNNLNVGANVTGNGALTLIATGGSISGSGTIQATDGAGIDLTLRQGASLDLANLTFSNQSNTDLMVQSHTGGVTIDETKPANAADQWKSISATAVNNIEVSSDGDIRIGSDGLSSSSGGVKVVSTGGTISVLGDGPTPTPITGSSNQTLGTGVGLLKDDGQKAAIVIWSPSEGLTLGANVTLTASGSYDPTNDDREAVKFTEGDPIDVAIYLGSYDFTHPPSDPSHNVAIYSQVSTDPSGTMVIDADETVTFDGAFKTSNFIQTNRLEIVSRLTSVLDNSSFHRLPYARNPAAIRNAFAAAGGSFTGAYILRGATELAKVLDLADPVPWAVPRPLELEMGSEVEEPDMDAIMQFLEELGLEADMPLLAMAYQESLSTDLRLYKSVEKLMRLEDILNDSSRIAVLIPLIQGITENPVTIEEQMASFVQELNRQESAGQWVNALTEFVAILNIEIGRELETSMRNAMRLYGNQLGGEENELFVEEYLAQRFLD